MAKKTKRIKRALCIGINDYGGKSDLDGCINDSLLNLKVLKSVYKFDEFKVLTDSEATKFNIKQALDWLVTDLPPNSIVVLTYSGHGTSIPCTTSTATSELDSMDECMVTYDFDPKDPIRDNELGAQFKNLDPSIHIFVQLDCCMSGTGLRNPIPKGAKNRYLKPPPSTMVDAGIINIGDSLEYLNTKIKKKKVEKVPFLIHTIDQGNAILLSGCADFEYSADAYFGAIPHGACTFFMGRVLQEHDWKITYKELATKMNKELNGAGFTSQTPQLECDNCFNDLFLGGLQ